MTDSQILRRMKAGEQAALEALMAKYRRYVYTIAANMLGNAGSAADAEELAADAFYAVWEHAADIRPGKLKAYLCVTARNKAKSWLRARRELPMDLDTIDLPDGGDGLEETVLREELASRVRRAVRSMKPRDREIFLRYYYYLQSSQEIAAAMGLPAGTVRSRLSRGRTHLKEILTEEGLP